MKLDVTKLPLGEALVGFVFAAVVLTFVLAFMFAPDAGIQPEDGTGAGLSPMSSGDQASDLVQRGREIAAVNGCLACHSTTGETIVGPTWKGAFGEPVTLVDGTEVVVDEAYVRESLQDPAAKIVEGFTPVMPVFSGLSDDDIQAIIAFMKSVK